MRKNSVKRSIENILALATLFYTAWGLLFRGEEDANTAKPFSALLLEYFSGKFLTIPDAPKWKFLHTKYKSLTSDKSSGIFSVTNIPEDRK